MTTMRRRIASARGRLKRRYGKKPARRSSARKPTAVARVTRRRRKAAPMKYKVTKPMAKALDRYANRKVVAHHCESSETFNMLHHMGSTHHGITTIMPAVLQAGTVTATTGGNITAFQPNNFQSREGSKIAIRSWTVRVLIWQQNMLFTDVSIGVPNPDGEFETRLGDYIFDVWIAYNKQEDDAGLARGGWTTAPTMYKDTAWRNMSGSTPTGQNASNPIYAQWLTPNTDQMQIVAKRTFRMTAAQVYRGNMIATGVGTLGAMVRTPSAAKRTLTFQIARHRKTWKFDTTKDFLPTKQPLMYIQFRRVDGGIPDDNLWNGSCSTRVTFNDAA